MSIQNFILISLMNSLFLTAAHAQPAKGASVAAPATATPEQVEIKADEGMTLESTLNLRDPFSRYTVKEKEGIAGKPLPELERYELDTYKLIGVITGPKKNKAMLTAPNGKMHIVTENAVIGTRKGMIKRIDRSGVIVHEKIINLLGQEEKIETVISFKSETPPADGSAFNVSSSSNTKDGE